MRHDLLKLNVPHSTDESGLLQMPDEMAVESYDNIGFGVSAVGPLDDFVVHRPSIGEPTR